MASKLPITKQIALFSVIIQVLFLAIIYILYYFFSSEEILLKCVITYLVISISLRTLIPSSHRKGISLYKQKKFAEAIPCFQQSYKFFSKYQWLDKYRYITVLSSSRISYSEMALLNEAFCLTQIEKKSEAIEKYENVLNEFPGSEMAISALKLLK